MSLVVHTTVFCMAMSTYSGNSTSWYMNELTPLRIMVTLAVNASSLISRMLEAPWRLLARSDCISEALCPVMMPAPIVDVRMEVPWPSMSCFFLFLVFFLVCRYSVCVGPVAIHSEMIEAFADGKYKCFKCRKKRPLQSFLYNNQITEETRVPEEKLEDCLKDYVEHGHAWACEDCFMKSGFIRKLDDEEDIKTKPSDRWPDCRYEDLTKCIHCHMYWPFWDYSPYNKWMIDSEGNKKDIASPDALHAFIREKRMIWGCHECYTQSGLCAVRKEGNVRWKAYKPTGEKSRAEIARYHRSRGDYNAVD